LLQGLPERHQALLLLGIGRCIHQHADAPHPLALLRRRCYRPRRSGAADQGDELAASHSFQLAIRVTSKSDGRT
jgi:hypothetical protein